MLKTSNDIGTFVTISGKTVALYLDKKAVRLFSEAVDEWDAHLGFTLYEFAHLVHAASLSGAGLLSQTCVVNVPEIFETLNTWKNSKEGQKEIERIAKSLMKEESFKDLIRIYEQRKQMISERR